MSFPLPALTNDGLPVANVGRWAEHKYRLVGYYASVFASRMKKQWDNRIYIDLFAGPGRARIRGIQRFLPTSPIIALDIDDPFDEYIFCEIDPILYSALRERLNRDYPSLRFNIIEGNCNQKTNDIISSTPIPSSQSTSLTFCFVDPFRVENLEFNTLMSLSVRFIDFLVLIPSHMDINRNQDTYMNTANEKLDKFIGTDTWRKRWENLPQPKPQFGNFITDEFGNQMKSLGFIYNGLQETELIRHSRMNIPLYRLAFFSKDPLGTKFWNESRIYAQNQLSFFG